MHLPRPNGAVRHHGLVITDREAVLSHSGQVVAREHLPSGCVERGDIVDADALAAALGGLLRRRGGRGPVHVALASPRVVTRILELPAVLTGDELAGAVTFQARDVLPMDPEAVVLNHLVGPVSGDRQSVLLVAVERSALEVLETTLAQAGARSAVVVAGPTLLAGLADPQGGELVVDVGNLLHVAIVQDGRCVFFRSAPPGLAAAQRRAVTAFGLSEEAAVDWLQRTAMGTVDSDDLELTTALRTIVRETIGEVVSETAASLDYALRSAPEMAVTRVRLCGPIGSWPAIAAALGDELGIEVVPAPEASAPLAALASTERGLELARTGRRRGTLPAFVPSADHVLIACSGAVAAFGIVAGLEHRSAGRAQDEVTAITARNAALTQRAATLKPAQTLADARKGMEDGIRQVVDARFAWRPALTRLAAAAPARIRLDDVRATVDGSVTLADGAGGPIVGALRSARPNPAVEVSGCAPDNRAVARFAARLGRTSGVTTVSLGRVDRAEKSADCDGTTFTAVAFYERFAKPGALSTAPASPTPTPAPGAAPAATKGGAK